MNGNNPTAGITYLPPGIRTTKTPLAQDFEDISMKIARLETEIVTGPLPAKQYTILGKQLDIMKNYQHVLRERLDAQREIMKEDMFK
jgi:hypothetical protein